jgi:hypothetical protein
MVVPVRLTLSRRRGFKLKAASQALNGLPAKSVARPGPWGNPFEIGRDGTRASCVARYREWLWQPQQQNFRNAARRQLINSNLACWCAQGIPCHADVLLEMLVLPDKDNKNSKAAG